MRLMLSSMWPNRARCPRTDQRCAPPLGGSHRLEALDRGLEEPLRLLGCASLPGSAPGTVEEHSLCRWVFGQLGGALEVALRFVVRGQ